MQPRAGGLVDKDSSMKISLYWSLAAAFRRGLRQQIRPAPARPPRGARNPRGRGMRESDVVRAWRIWQVTARALSPTRDSACC